LTSSITVIGAGPAGSAAAIEARLLGARVTIYERSKLPAHRVCGEFLSPEIVPLLERFGVWSAIEECGPARYFRLGLYFRSERPGACVYKRLPFSEPPFGFSRHRLDRMLLDRALDLGAALIHEQADASEFRPLIVAHGRHPDGPSARRSGNRMFGFKAHFDGTAKPDEPLELYFFDGGYAGVNLVEGGSTNVCGVASESFLHRYAFDADGVIRAIPMLATRLAPLRRSMDWMYTGPLLYHQPPPKAAAAGVYLAGDALSFTAPFTGSGILSAVLTGSLAGRHAAQGIDVAHHVAACSRALRPAYWATSVFRALLRTSWAVPLIRFVPGRVLVSLTRPTVRSDQTTAC